MMRLRFHGGLALASALSLLLVATPAVAATPTVERSHGNLVDVAFTTTDAIVCPGGGPGTRAIRSTYRGDEDLFSGPGYAVESSFLQVSVTVSDSCSSATQEYSGVTTNHYGSVSIAKNGKTATAGASSQLYGGDLTEEDYAFADVSVQLVGNDKPVRSLTFDRIKSADGVTFVGSIEKARSADVGGSFVVTGTGVPYLDGRNLLVGAKAISAKYATSRWVSISH